MLHYFHAPQVKLHIIIEFKKDILHVLDAAE